MSQRTGKRHGTTRRNLLIGAGIVAAGIAVAYTFGRRYVPVFPSSSDPGADDGVAWIRIAPDGSVHLTTPAHELGQGSSIGLAQVVAEELNVAATDVSVAFATTQSLPHMRFTTGSQVMALHTRPAARAAAALREEMRRRAAARLDLAVTDLADGEGGFAAPDGRTIGYGAIAAGEAVLLDEGELPEAPLYTFDRDRTHRQIGAAPQPVQAHDIVTGGAVFAADMRLPGMAYGRAVQAPLVGARIVAVDTGTAETMPGVVKLVVDRGRGLVGVVAETPAALDRAMAEISVRWDRPEPFSRADIEDAVDVDQALAKGALERRILDETIAEAGDWDVDLRVDLPVLHHAAQEPRAALARLEKRDGRTVVDIWTGSQDIFVNANKAAAELGWSTDRVTVHAMRVGGAFGGRALYDVVREAVLLAQEAGRPVKVVWSRSDEFVGDRNRPPSSHRIRVRTKADGAISDWWQATVSGHVLLSEILAPEWLLTPMRWAMADFGATRGIVGPYAAAARRIEFSDVTLPVHVGQWRSLGATPNTFAIESVIDELALKLGRDPVAYRLANLAPENRRLAVCLEKVRELAESEPLKSGPSRGRGYACGIYHDHSYVAAAFDVTVDAERTKAKVDRASIAIDVGMAINPDQIRAQAEGCVMMAIGQVLMEEARIVEGGIAARRFSDYPTPTLADAPEIAVAVIDNRDIPPAGAGEAPLIAAVPALANAIRDATGIRLVRLPWRTGAA